MSEITAAVDEATASQLFTTIVAGIGPQSTSGSSNLGPFGVTYAATGTLMPGLVDLIPPGTIRIADLRLNWAVSGSFELRLGDFLPEIHIPQICIHIPCVGEVCTPRIDITWPTVSIPVSFGDYLLTTVDLGVAVSPTGSEWIVQGTVQGISNLQWGVGTAAILTGIGAAVALAVAWVPLIGPFVALLVLAVTTAIGFAGLTGWLGPIVTPFISGMRFEIYRQPVQFEVLAAAGPNDPAVFVRIDAVTAEVQHNAPEDELVLGIDISA
jgi:hypothetical protein